MSDSQGASPSPSSSRLPADSETLELLYRAEQDPVKKAVIRQQLEELRKDVQTR